MRPFRNSAFKPILRRFSRYYRISGFFRGNLVFAFFATIFYSPRIKHVEIMFLIVCHNKSLFIFLRVLKRLGFTPLFVRRARYFRANLSEDCYAPSRVLQDWKQERYFHSDILDYHSEGICNQVHFNANLLSS
jgi:hypothetical protein